MTINTRYLALLALMLLLPATAFAQEESTARFIIEKTWNQGGDQDGLDAIEVTGHLSCTGATTTQQDVVFTATTDAILFVYNLSLADGAVNCKVTETVPDNYTAEYFCQSENCADTEDSDFDYCWFYDVDDNPNDTYVCEIVNTPDPAEITVTKTWVIEGASQGFDGYHEITVLCLYGGYLLNANACQQLNVPGVAGISEVCVDDATAGSIDYVFTLVQPAYPESSCAVVELTYDSVIETDNGCGDQQLILGVGAGDEESCEIVNTVFFEGIPTLSQYGLAILALLMLGVGLVGFRRFV